MTSVQNHQQPSSGNNQRPDITTTLTWFLFLLIAVLHLSAFSQEPASRKKSEITETIGGQKYYIHQVGINETLNDIAALYGVSVRAIEDSNPTAKTTLSPGQVLKIPFPTAGEPRPVQAPAPKKPESQPDNKTTTHIVKEKETWYGIARQYGITADELQGANPGIDVLKSGQQLIIPVKKPDNQQVSNTISHKQGTASTKHEVKAGETLYSISKLYGISIEQIERLNPQVKSGLKAGQILTISPPKNDTQINNASGVSTARRMISDTSVTFIYHKVKKQETLFGIAKKYGITTNDIVRYNPHVAYRLTPKQVLKIPVYTISQKADIEHADMQKDDQPSDQQETPVTAPCIAEPRERPYRVAIMIPFHLNEGSDIINNPYSMPSSDTLLPFGFMQFYISTLLAIDSMSKTGLKAQVFYYDVDENPSSARAVLRKPELAEMDLIIGPVYSQSFDVVASFAKNNRITIVNPLSNRNEFLKGNEFAIKVQPSAHEQFSRLSKVIQTNQRDKNIVVIRQTYTGEQAGFQTITSKAGSSSLKEVIYIRDGLDGVRRNLSSLRENYLFVLSADKVFVLDLLRKLHELRNDFPMVVFGLSQWHDFQLETDYYINLRLNLPTNQFVDYSSEHVKRFIQKYRTEYKVEPDEELFAYTAYDIAFYFLSALHKYGRNFRECLSMHNPETLALRFDFHVNPGSGYENKGIQLIQASNFQFSVWDY